MVAPKVTDNALNKLVDVVIPREIVDFLNTIIVNNSWAWINYWSFLHIISGAIFYFVLRGNFLAWAIISIIFEVGEYLLSFWGHPIFVEELVDIVWDLAFNFAGFFLVKLIWENLVKVYQEKL